MDTILSNRILVQRACTLLLFALLGLSLTGWQDLAPEIEHALSLVGWMLVGIGMTGRIWCGTYISGRKNAQLIVDGPYSICRNPLYFFSFVGGLGLMLITETLALPILFSLVFLVYYDQLISREEATLSKLHGTAYDAYRAKVPRFWPDLRLYSEPEQFVASAALLRRNLGDAIWWVIAGGIIEFLEAMHVLNYLPTFLRIY